MKKHLWLICILIILFSPCGIAEGQTDQPRRLVYTLPAIDRVTVQKNVEYRKAGEQQLRLDFYRLPISEKPSALPVVVMTHTGFGGPNFKENIFQTEWARLFAASGFAAVTYQARSDNWGEDFDSMIVYLREHKSALGVDPQNVILHASSGNVFAGLPLAMDKNRDFIKAAVIYYGFAEVKELRTDVSLLLVRVGLDIPIVNRKIGEFVKRAMELNVPIEVINHPGGHHPFEIDDNDEFSRSVIARTLDFMHRASDSESQKAIRASMEEAGAGSALLMENWTQAIAGYEAVAKKKPDDPEIHRRLADSLFGATQYARAEQEYERAFALGSWRKRDISYPAAVSSIRTGNTDNALKWIARLIKTPFDKNSLRTDPNFEPVRNNPQFNALIEGKNQ